MGISDLFFERRCKLCNKNISSGAVCVECDKQLMNILQLRRRCINADGKDVDVLYLFDYDNLVVKKLLFALKRSADKELFLYVAGFYERILCDRNDVSIVFVPRCRINKRNYGYDHMQRVSKLLCKQNGERLYYRPIIKRKPFTKEQKYLDGERRKKNTEHAFKILKNDIPKNIVLVDDVITTGSTLLSCVSGIFANRSDAVVEIVTLASANRFSDV